MNKTQLDESTGLERPVSAPNKAQPRKPRIMERGGQDAVSHSPTLAEFQVQETLAINRLQHLDGALAEIQHLRTKTYTLTDERAKFARKAAHADKLAEACRIVAGVLRHAKGFEASKEILADALAAWEAGQ